MNCVVLGGGGFIGSHLAEELLRVYGNVTVFDKPEAPNLDLLLQRGANIVTGDFLETAHISKALVGATTIFHLISTTVPKSSVEDPIYDVESNLIGSLRLMKLAKDTGIKKIVFASSGGTVYGVPREIPISEDHQTNPICSYGIVKLAIEKYLHMFCTLFDLNYCILRVSNAYGERQPVSSSQGIISALIDKELHGKSFTIWGDGSVIRDYIHVGDITSAYIAAGEYSGESRVFNIGSGIGHSLNDIVDIFQKIMKKNIDLIYENGRAYDVPVNILDISRAKNLLNWEPKISLTDGIRQTLEYVLNS